MRLCIMKVPQTLCSLWVSLYLFVKTLVVSQELRVFEYNWSKLSERKTICQLNTVFNVCNLKRKEADVLILFFGAVTLRLSCLSVGGFVIRYCKPIIPVFPWVQFYIFYPTVLAIYFYMRDFELILGHIPYDDDA